MLTIENLKANVEEKEILKGINLDIKPGEVHAIMGPNGSGKSTLANVLSGRDGYDVTDGSVTFDNRDLLALAPEARAQAGIFLAFQYPVEIPGISNINFMNAAVNAIRRSRGESEMDAMDFLTLIKKKADDMGIAENMLYRSVNEGFSGGEKKRNEVLQMELLQPKLAILDETDSGLDIDALKAVSDGVNSMRSPDRSFLVITHYQRLLDYIKPDHVHVLYNGKIIKSGDASLALQLEEKGYGWLTDGAEV